ncbi:uncharacterized protein LOC126895864 [Daktulosphaira vitifoliae]|uniref:uncharacterized protein LOC126895864 n=1 Tax=Daktulosphaira vitifoliae TaxID=58002 RepID=UPI0021AA5B98|nr:uncharacterized protein LOC126895864 [Daktulosphaira vitifoliae]
MGVFIQHLNSFYPSIKFTYEQEIEGKLPFLDLLVKRTEGELNFEIYRKNTHTFRYIPNTSNHTWQHKLSAFNSMVYRLINIPMNKIDYDKELVVIKEIAKFNGYNENIILKLVRKQKWKKERRAASTLSSEGEQKVIRSPILFYPGISNGLTKIFKNFGITLVTSKSNNLRDLLGNPKDKVDEGGKSGIYKIQCESCNKCYVGQTKRNIGVRFKEHLRNIKNQEVEKSPVAEHLLTHNHSIKTIKLIKNVNNYKELNIREAIEMFKNKNNLINWDLGPLKNSLLNLCKLAKCDNIT